MFWIVCTYNQKCFVSFSLSGYFDKKSRSKVKITILKKLKRWFIPIQFHIQLFSTYIPDSLRGDGEDEK